MKELLNYSIINLYLKIGYNAVIATVGIDPYVFPFTIFIVDPLDEVIPDSAFPEQEECKLGCEHEYNRCTSSGVNELDCFVELSTCFEQCRNKKELEYLVNTI